MILVDGKRTGLFTVNMNNQTDKVNIFIIPEIGNKFDGNILICKLEEDNRCYILYKIHISIFDLLESDYYRFLYSTEILKDNEKVIGVVFLSTLRVRKRILTRFYKGEI